MPSLLAAGLLLAFAPLTAACGSDDDGGPKAPAMPGNSTSDAAVLRACTSFAERLCAGAEACCTSSEGSFSQAGCVDAMAAELCVPAAQLVAAGRAEYDASAEEACLAAHQRAHDTCVPDWDEIVASRREVWSACRVVSGKVRPGGSCTTSTMCASPEGEATSECVQGVCRERSFLAQGEPCPYPLGNVSVCGPGLYCTALARGETGSCEPATAEGEACDPVPMNPECGLGRYCDLTDGTCRLAVNFGGPSCEQDDECVSFVCDGVTGECRDAPSTVVGLCGVSS
jgi:hypothetical protein